MENLQPRPSTTTESTLEHRFYGAVGRKVGPPDRTRENRRTCRGTFMRGLILMSETLMYQQIIDKEGLN